MEPKDTLFIVLFFTDEIEAKKEYFVAKTEEEALQDFNEKYPDVLRFVAIHEIHDQTLRAEYLGEPIYSPEFNQS